jgi:hypothetical protein
MYAIKDLPGLFLWFLFIDMYFDIALFYFDVLLILICLLVSTVSVQGMK